MRGGRAKSIRSAIISCAERLLHDRRQLAPPLGIFFIGEQRLSPRGNIGQRIIDLVAQAVGEVVERLQLGGFESGGEISGIDR